MTEWLPIKDFPSYEVSDDGQIRRVNAASGAIVGKILVSHPRKNGYLIVSLRRDGRTHTKGVHRVLCETFHGPCPSANHECAHDDGKKQNNSTSNVLWKTKEENQEDRRRHGTSRGVKNPAAKLTEEQVVKIFSARGTQRDVAAMFGVSQRAVLFIRQRKTWEHVEVE